MANAELSIPLESGLASAVSGVPQHLHRSIRRAGLVALIAGAMGFGFALTLALSSSVLANAGALIVHARALATALIALPSLAVACGAFMLFYGGRLYMGVARRRSSAVLGDLR